MGRCACTEPSCMCTTVIPADGQALCQYCCTFGHQDPDAYWAELLAAGASDDEADAARSELVRQRQEAVK